MVTALSALARLEVLHFELECYIQRDSESRHLPLPPRAILTSLTALKFEGFNSEYLEDLVARIDVPLLDHLHIAFTYFFDRDIVLDTSQLLRFISRIPKFQAPYKAHIGIRTDFSWPKQISSAVRLGFYCREPERPITRLVQFRRSPFSPFPTLEYLYICGGRYSPKSPQENTRWLELFQPFTAVKNLYLFKEYAPHIAPVLQKFVGERALEVLPTLENVFIEFRPS
jgi:hypothetical protein